VPSNIRQLKAKLKKAVVNPSKKDAESLPGAQMQQIAASILMKNLARFTPIDTGELAAGWTLNLKKGARGGSTELNRSKRVSIANLEKIDKINGKSDITITNDVEHGVYLNFGTKYIAARAFVQRAIAATKRELAALKIPVKIKIG